MDIIKEQIGKMKEDGFDKLTTGGSDLRREIRERTIGYMVAAFGFVAGLAWNEAIQALIAYFFPLSRNSVFAKLLYAVLVTIVVVFISMYLVRFAGKPPEKKE